ncbi:MAG: hypothetical protein ACKVJU_07200 [Verrucomicrobiales bacterium]
MVTTDTQSYELRNAIDDYINFIDEHIFWIRSSPAINFDEVKHLPVGIRWLFSPRNWTEVIGHLFAGISSSPAKALLGFLVIGVLMGNRRRLRRIIREAGVTASHLGAKFRFTVTSFFATIFYAAAWPSIFGFLGWLLKASGGDE